MFYIFEWLELNIYTYIVNRPRLSSSSFSLSVYLCSAVFLLLSLPHSNQYIPAFKGNIHRNWLGDIGQFNAEHIFGVQTKWNWDNGAVHQNSEHSADCQVWNNFEKEQQINHSPLKFFHFMDSLPSFCIQAPGKKRITSSAQLNQPKLFIRFFFVFFFCCHQTKSFARYQHSTYLIAVRKRSNAATSLVE